MSYRLATILSLLLTLLLSTPTACSTLIPRNLTAPPTLSLFNPILEPQTAPPPPEIHCAKTSFFKSERRPSFSECFRAIRNLPDTHDSGTFHSSSHNTVWRLPRIETFGRCRAQVELATSARAPSSWIAVKSALDDLSVRCRKSAGVSKKERTGGWMLMGLDGLIKVSLVGIDDPKVPHDVADEIDVS